MSGETTENKANVVNFTIDGKAVSVPKGTTVYTAAKMNGIELPIFCYQDRMPPFGACRVCLVEVEKMPKLQTSCTLEATEGMVVKTQSDAAKKGREGILEFLLINHPLDCPICDRGGECPLQDQTIKFGPGISRFFEEKRHFKKALPLGPVLMLDRERCIVCARCTRFSDIVSGDHALEFIERGYKTEVGTPDGKPVESKFIGNTIMICPVGALTSNVYRFRARPWDNDSVESACTLCPVGCSLNLDSRNGVIMRTRSCENRDLNDVWLCDKGWFGYEFSDHPERLKQPLIRKNGKLEPASWDEALKLAAEKIKEAIPTGKLGAFGGNPLTLEENYLFQQLMRKVIGVNHVDHRIGSPIFSRSEEGLSPGMEQTIGECADLSYAILLGIDLTEEFPVIWLRLKEAINKGAKVIFMGHYAPEIAPHLHDTILHPPGDETKELHRIGNLAKNGGKGAIFVGRQYLASLNRGQIVSELEKLKESIPGLTLNLLEGRGNSIGARLAGMHPELGPLGTHIDNPGLNALQLLETAAKSGWDYLHVAGANPAKKIPSKLWKEARSNLKFLVVQDLFLTETAQEADIVLPTLSFIEKEGSFVNIEGRVQKLKPGRKGHLYSDGELFTQLALKLGTKFSLDAKLFEGKFLKFSETRCGHEAKESASQQGLKATFAPMLFDNGVRMKHNPHLIRLAKKSFVRIHPEEGRKLGIHSGDTLELNEALFVKVKFDDKVAKGTVVIPLAFDRIPAHELGANLLNGMVVEIRTKNPTAIL